MMNFCSEMMSFTRSPMEDDLPRVVAFGNDAVDLLVLYHQERADALLRHQLDGVEY
jgi:hypothetical protein